MTIYFWIILAVCVLDQLTKVWTMDMIAAANNISADALANGCTKPLFEGVLHLTYLENPGMSFGLLADHRWVFLTLSAVGILALLAYLIYIKGEDRLLSVSLALVIGGGIGNMFDRLTLGYVVDFFDFRLFSFWKWIFNFADACVCVGAALMILAVLLSYKKEQKNA